MFLRNLSCLVVLAAMACNAATSPASKPKDYILDNLKHLHKLVRKKKSAKPVLPLGILFDEYVDDTKELLKILDEQSLNEKQDAKKEEVVKQIAHYMAVLQKLLTIMNSNQPEPLKTYCHAERGDALWGSLCGDRPAKRVLRPERLLKKYENEQASGLVKIHYADEDDNLQLDMGKQ
ncbi:MAG: hypothetical protein ACOYKA_06495 [Legionellaceae bacterium]